MSKEKQEGIVYVLENAAMPGIVKIGRTSRDTIEERLGELYSTGVPVPFDCVYAAKVADAERVEKALQDAFGPYDRSGGLEYLRVVEERRRRGVEVGVTQSVLNLRHQAV